MAGKLPGNLVTLMPTEFDQRDEILQESPEREQLCDQRLSTVANHELMYGDSNNYGRIDRCRL